MTREGRLDVAGIGSMVVDRVHRTPHIIGADAKVVLRDVESGEPVRSYVGGVVLNHLGWASVLGLRTGIFGRQGDDADGRFLRAAMDRLEIERDLVLEGSATSMAEIFVDDVGARAIYMHSGATEETTPEHLRQHHAGIIARAARLTTEVSQLPLRTVLEAQAIAREAGTPNLVDFDVPASDALAGLGSEIELDAVLRGATILKPAKLAAGEMFPEARGDALALARAMRRLFESEAVIVTDGEAGCAILADGFEGRVPAPKAKAIDTTGAGDAFLGGLLTGLHHGLGWEDVGRLANAAGATCTEKLGAFPDDPSASRARVLELYKGPAVDLGPLPRGQDVSRRGGAEEALAAFDIAVEELDALHGRMSTELFERALVLIRQTRAAGGRVHVTGIGKPEHVAHYGASLLSSTGTPATFLHATEVVHGSAGQIVAGDVVIAISNSGETFEMREAVTAIKKMGGKIIGVTGRLESWLARESDAVLDAGVTREGGPLGLAPRASAAAEVLVLGALAAALERETGFTRADYNLRHPGGKLGELSRE